jgi:hypothetical protein
VADACLGSVQLDIEKQIVTVGARTAVLKRTAYLATSFSSLESIIYITLISQ